jgi:cytosine/uracil/thiamine/allantoin permease
MSLHCPKSAVIHIPNSCKCSGLMLADYHIIRRHRLKLSDLYRGDSNSLYWFRSGVNWRAFAAFTAGMWPLLRMCPFISLQLCLRALIAS